MTPHNDYLTDDEWREMFAGPEWSDELVEEMGRSLRAAYRMHVNATRKQG